MLGLEVELGLTVTAEAELGLGLDQAERPDQPMRLVTAVATPGLERSMESPGVSSDILMAIDTSTVLFEPASPLELSLSLGRKPSP